MLPKVLVVTALYNRHFLMERTLASFIEQDYKGEHELFIYNTGESQELDNLQLPENKRVVLVNNTIDLITGEQYKNVGDKYRDALSYIKEDWDIITFLDSDDFALPDHITNGVKGIQKAKSIGRSAYKPKYSFSKGNNIYSIIENVCEGSIFIEYSFLRTCSFLPSTVTYHNGWLHPLLANNLILVDPDGFSTWIYGWGEEFPVFKTSGGQDNYQNFINTQKNSRDIGDIILVPWSKETMNTLYNNIKDFYTNLNKN